MRGEKLRRSAQQNGTGNGSPKPPAERERFKKKRQERRDGRDALNRSVLPQGQTDGIVNAQGAIVIPGV